MSNPELTNWSSGALLKVARGQRRVLQLILLGLLVGIVFGFMAATGADLVFLAPWVGLGFGLVQLSNLWRLAEALRSPVPWVYCLLAIVLGIIPILGLMPLLVLNQSATKVLQANGIRVGFLGANLADFGAAASGPPSFGPDECSLCGKYLKNADEVLECRKCRLNVCDSCAVRKRESAGMVESFTVTCPKCSTELSEVRRKTAPVEEPAAEDFDKDE